MSSLMSALSSISSFCHLTLQLLSFVIASTIIVASAQAAMMATARAMDSSTAASCRGSHDGRVQRHSLEALKWWRSFRRNQGRNKQKPTLILAGNPEHPLFARAKVMLGNSLKAWISLKWDKIPLSRFDTRTVCSHLWMKHRIAK